MSTPLYKNYLISESGDFTVLIIRADVHAEEGEEDFTKITGFDLSEGKGSPDIRKKKTALTNKQISEFVATVRKVAAKYQSKDFPILLASDPIMDELHMKLIHSDIGRSVVFVALAILLFLCIIFRRLSGVLLPFVVISLSLFSGLGLMVLMGVCPYPRPLNSSPL